MANKLDLDYQNLLKDILENGTKKSDRTGTGTLSVFSREIRHKLSTGFPLLTTKKMAFKTIVTELLWFLKGDTNIKYLVDNNCHIWDGDAYKAFEKEKKMLYDYATKEAKKYSPEFNPAPLRYESKEEFIDKIKNEEGFSEKWGNLGEIYGKQWRKWTFTEYEKTEKGIQAKIGFVDQISNLINDLKANPDSRRLMVSAWNPGTLDKCVLPPCHYGFQCWTRELTTEERNKWFDKNLGYGGSDKGGKNNWKDFELDQQNIPKRAISLSWNQRSIDTALGLPYNISSYSLLLSMIAKQVSMIPYEIIGNLGDCHIYLNQIDGVNEQLLRESYELPIVKISDKIVNDISEYALEDITLENYKSHPKIHFPLSN